VNAARSDPPTPRDRARTRAQRSDGSRSGRRVIRRRGSGDESAENRRMRISGCASSRDSLPRRLRSTRRRTRKRRRRATGGRPLLRGGSLRPLTESCGGGGGTSARGGRGSACHRAVYGRGGTRRGGIWRRDGGGVGRGLSARRALGKEEIGLLHPEVGHRSSRHSVSRGVSLILSISHLQGGADRPPPPCACKSA
jgi:hypothetical protein